MQEVVRMTNTIGKAINRIGIPTFAVGLLLLVLLITAGVQGQSIPTLITDILNRVGMNGLLVLAMVPTIKSGTGPNFALPVGIEGGLMTLMICMQFDFSGWFLIFTSLLLSVVLCTILGWLYGKLMNAVKGAEMTIATYSGFSIVAFFNIFWLAIPFSNRKMGWMLGNGLRETIQFKNFNASRIISDLLKIHHVLNSLLDVADRVVQYSADGQSHKCNSKLEEVCAINQLTDHICCCEKN